MLRSRRLFGLLPTLLALLVMPGVATSVIAAEHAQGERLFRSQCIGCHSLAPGEHLAGPSLHDLMGRPAGGIPGFDYSPVLEDADFVWNAETLDAFLADPDAFLPGTRMVLWGLDEHTRQRIIGYLESIAGP